MLHQTLHVRIEIVRVGHFGYLLPTPQLGAHADLHTAIVVDSLHDIQLDQPVDYWVVYISRKVGDASFNIGVKLLDPDSFFLISRASVKSQAKDL